MKIAVIVSTYNRPDALEKVLNGLLAQTRLPDEIIVADDGSGAPTRKMLGPYLALPCVVVRHVWQEDDGFRAARIRNLAIKASTSEYLILLDGDCIPEAHFVDDHLALAAPGFFFQGKRVIVSQKASQSFDVKDTRSFFSRVKHVLTGAVSNAHHLFRIPFFPAYTTQKHSGVRSCNMGFFRSDLVAVNGFNQDFSGWGREDSELVVRLYKYGIKRKEHPFRAICYHLWHLENDRNTIDRNDRLLAEAMASDQYCCRSGINEYE